jgi:hypothetical protein
MAVAVIIRGMHIPTENMAPSLLVKNFTGHEVSRGGDQQRKPNETCIPSVVESTRLVVGGWRFVVRGWWLVDIVVYQRAIIGKWR